MTEHGLLWHLSGYGDTVDTRLTRHRSGSKRTWPPVSSSDPVGTLTRGPEASRLTGYGSARGVGVRPDPR